MFFSRSLPKPVDVGLSDEKAFNRVLCLERKRTERTGDPFVLMLLDIAELNGSAPARKIAEMCRAVHSETRDTDVWGWYLYPSAIGAIFTTLRGADRRTVQSALMAKTDRALHQVLAPPEVKKVSVSLHFFPEETDKDHPGIHSDDLLYPDLKHHNGHGVLRSVLKRSIDIVGSIFALLVFSPFFIVIPVLIKLTSEGPVFFKQRRIGKFGREFMFLKYRSMYINNDPEIHRHYVEKLIRQEVDGGSDSKPVYKIVNDPRVTPLGHFLRKTSLDELPQFINVLKADMSLVGPRPPIPYEIASYRAWHRRRVIEVKPGITGLWQVYGRSRTTFDEMVRLDLRYVRDQSIWLDLKILLRTPFAILSGDGAY